MHIPAAALLASTLLLSGCAHIMQKPLVEGPTTATPLPMAPAATGGSLFQAGQAMNYGYQPMFEDRRPRNVGDTLTILLQENVSASKSSSASANRNGSAGMGLIAVPTKLNGWLGDGKADFEAEGKNDFAGKGGAAARNTFISVRDSGGSLQHVRSSTDLNAVIRALNSLGATPNELMSVLQAMKSAGCLRAKLEVN